MIDRWSLGVSGASKEETLEVTTSCREYTFQKTIKTPLGGAKLILDPQIQDPELRARNFMDLLKPLDVVRIYEFDNLKFVGYIRDVHFTGMIDPNSGQPYRFTVLTCTYFPGIVVEARAGVDLHYLRERQGTFYEAQRELAEEWYRSFEGKEAISLAQVIRVFSRVWFRYIQAVTGSSSFFNYLSTYTNIGGGVLSGIQLYNGVREIQFFKGGENDFSFWQVLERVAEAPLNELWFDNGPRDLISNEKVNLVARPTPFDGTVGSNGGIENRFQQLGNSIIIPLDHLLRFDLNKSMEEVYSGYVVSSAVMDLNKEAVIAFGAQQVDNNNLAKYLWRPMFKRLFYLADPAKYEELADTTVDPYQDSVAKTLKNWFQNNDRFLSGVIQIHVPEDNASDPKIGQKVSIEGVEGDFYCESIVHNWRYKGSLVSNVGVTRGFNKGRDIQLRNVIFNSPFIGGTNDRRHIG